MMSMVSSRASSLEEKKSLWIKIFVGVLGLQLIVLAIVLHNNNQQSLSKERQRDQVPGHEDDSEKKYSIVEFQVPSSRPDFFLLSNVKLHSWEHDIVEQFQFSKAKSCRWFRRNTKQILRLVELKDDACERASNLMAYNPLDFDRLYCGIQVPARSFVEFHKPCTAGITQIIDTQPHQEKEKDDDEICMGWNQLVTHPFRESWIEAGTQLIRFSPDAREGTCDKTIEESKSATVGTWTRVVSSVHSGVFDITLKGSGQDLTYQLEATFAKHSNFTTTFEKTRQQHWTLENNETRWTILTNWPANNMEYNDGVLSFPLDGETDLTVRIIRQDNIIDPQDDNTSYFCEMMIQDFWNPIEMFLIDKTSPAQSSGRSGWKGLWSFASRGQGGGQDCQKNANGVSICNH